MRKINLLDWRAELVKENQKETGIAAGIAAALGLGVWFMVNWYFNDQINFQNEVNTHIEKEIKILDRQIEEVKALEETKARLISRMEIIDELQKSRPEEVRLFDDMVKIIPEGTYFEAAKQVGKKINFVGITDSNTRVSALMREIMAAETLANPDLAGKGITTVLDGRRRISLFELSAEQVSSQKDSEEEEE